MTKPPQGLDYTVSVIIQELKTDRFSRPKKLKTDRISRSKKLKTLRISQLILLKRQSLCPSVLNPPNLLNCSQTSNPVDSRNHCEHESILLIHKLAFLMEIRRNSSKSWKEYMKQYLKHTIYTSFTKVFLAFPYYI